MTLNALRQALVEGYSGISDRPAALLTRHMGATLAPLLTLRGGA